MKKLVFALVALAALVQPALAQNHDVQLTVTLASACNAAKPCNTNIYRLAVAGPTSSCPTTLNSYTQIGSNLPGTTVTAMGTTTVFDDQDPTLTTGASYCYAATDLFISGGGESAPGPTALVTFPAPPAGPSSLGAVIKK